MTMEEALSRLGPDWTITVDYSGIRFTHASDWEREIPHDGSIAWALEGFFEDYAEDISDLFSRT